MRRRAVVIGPAPRRGLWMIVATSTLIGAAVIAVAAPRVLAGRSDDAAASQIAATEYAEAMRLAAVAPAAEPPNAARPSPPPWIGSHAGAEMPMAPDKAALAPPSAAAMRIWEYETGQAGTPEAGTLEAGTLEAGTPEIGAAPGVAPATTRAPAADRPQMVDAPAANTPDRRPASGRGPSPDAWAARDADSARSRAAASAGTGPAGRASQAIATAPQPRATEPQPIAAAARPAPSPFAAELRLAYLAKALDAVEAGHLDAADALAKRAERVRLGDIPPPPALETPVASTDVAWVIAAKTLERAETARARTEHPVAAAAARAALDCWRLTMLAAASAKPLGRCREDAQAAIVTLAAAGVIPGASRALQPAPSPGDGAVAAMATASIEAPSPSPSTAGPRSPNSVVAAYADGFEDSVAYFALDSAALSDRAVTGLVALAEELTRSDPSRRDGDEAPLYVAISGHADSAGSEGFNEMLSLRRAEAVRAALATALPEGAGVVLEAHGERALRVPTADGVIEPKNRRVEITIGR